MKKDNQDKANIKDYLSQEIIVKLPTWIRENLETAYITGKNKQTIELLDGRRFSLKNNINDLAGSAWTKQLCSVINTNYPTKGVESYAYNIRKAHPTPKPPQLMKNLIEFFTKENEVVFDYFMGVGGSLIGASLCLRRGAGIDLNPIYVETYIKAANELKLPVQPCAVGDSNLLLNSKKKIMNLLSNEKAGMILIDPPYSNMMSRPKTGAGAKTYGKEATPFSNHKSDLGNMQKHTFIERLTKIVGKSMKFLKDKGYIVVFCKDIQPEGKAVNLLHSDIINSLSKVPSLYYKGLKIWADQTTKLFPYGYPFDFVANQIHQYILIFRKI